MADISIRYDNNIVVLKESRVVRGYFSIDTVEVLNSDGHTIRLSYLGTCPYPISSQLPVQYVKLVNIIAYHAGSFNLSEPIDIPTLHYCVGVYDNKGVYLAIKDGKPVSFPINKDIAKESRN